MSDRKDKTPEQVSDEDYKVAPTSADKQILNKSRSKDTATGENYHFPADSAAGHGERKKEELIGEELKEGVE